MVTRTIWQHLFCKEEIGSHGVLCGEIFYVNGTSYIVTLIFFVFDGLVRVAVAKTICDIKLIFFVGMGS